MKFFVWKGFILRKWPRYRTISTSFSRRWAHVALRSQKLGQANKVIGGDTEDEDGAHLSEAAHLHLREPPTVLLQPKLSSMRLRSRWLIA